MSIRLKSKQWCYNGKYYKAALDRKLRGQKQSRTKVCKECQKEALKVKWNFGSQKRGMKTTFEGEDVNHSMGKASPGNAEDSCSFEQLLKKKKLRHIVCARLLQSCPTLCDHIYGLQPTRLLCPSDSPGKNSALLQRVFLTQGLNLCLLHLPGLAGRFFTTGTTWEAPKAHYLLIYSFQKRWCILLYFIFGHVSQYMGS